MKRIHLIVSGRVQGVGFRYFSAERAEQLGLTGYVRNKPDGTVEVEVQGDDAMLAEFKKAIHQGPRSANVTHIENSDMSVVSDERDFLIH